MRREERVRWVDILRAAEKAMWRGHLDPIIAREVQAEVALLRERLTACPRSLQDGERIEGLLTERETAWVTGVSTETLRKLRDLGEAPSHVRLPIRCGRVRYPEQGVALYLALRKLPLCAQPRS
jgi:hypothetical protein